MKGTASGTKRARIYNAPLSAREVGLLAGWERERRVVVTLQQLVRQAGAGAGRKVAARLIRKKVLDRVGAGRYLIRPLRTRGRASSVSAPVVAAALLQGERFYLGGLWALTFHRLTEQQYTTLDVFLARRLSPRSIAGARLTFHRVGKGSLAYGIAETEIEGVRLLVSTPERTLLDLLDLPALAGGGSEALRHFAGGLPQVSAPQLVELAARGSRTSTCQRLGVLLERAGVSPRKLQPLRRRVRATKSSLSLVPGAPRTGAFNAVWRVVENDR